MTILELRHLLFEIDEQATEISDIGEDNTLLVKDWSISGREMPDGTVVLQVYDRVNGGCPDCHEYAGQDTCGCCGRKLK